MSPPRILVIGQDPDTLDFSAIPGGMTAEKIRAGIDIGKRLMAEAGFTADHVLTDSGAAAAAIVSAALQAHDYGVVIVGAGIRLQAPQSGLLETVLNTIIARRPHAKVGFNQTPQDTVDAVKRLLA